MVSKKVRRRSSSPGTARAGAARRLRQARPGRGRGTSTFSGIRIDAIFIKLKESPAPAGSRCFPRKGQTRFAGKLGKCHSDTAPFSRVLVVRRVWSFCCLGLEGGASALPLGSSTTITTPPRIVRIIVRTIARIIRTGAPRLRGDVARYLKTVSLTRRSAGLPASTCLFKAGHDSIALGAKVPGGEQSTRGGPGLVDEGFFINPFGRTAGALDNQPTSH